MVCEQGTHSVEPRGHSVNRETRLSITAPGISGSFVGRSSFVNLRSVTRRNANMDAM